MKVDAGDLSRVANGVQLTALSFQREAASAFCDVLKEARSMLCNASEIAGSVVCTCLMKLFPEDLSSSSQPFSKALSVEILQ
jgi:hypothetical protein